MSFVVPFDGTKLAEAGLVRAAEYGDAMDEEVVVLTVISERKRYAEKKGWIEEGEQFDIEQVVEKLREQVQAIAPEATFEYEIIRESPPAEGIAARIERMALEHDPAVIFIGTDNVGRIVTPLSSVGLHVATDDDYDVYLVRTVEPPKASFLKSHPTFYDEVEEQD